MDTVSAGPQHRHRYRKAAELTSRFLFQKKKWLLATAPKECGIFESRLLDPLMDFMLNQPFPSSTLARFMTTRPKVAAIPRNPRYGFLVLSGLA